MIHQEDPWLKKEEKTYIRENKDKKNIRLNKMLLMHVKYNEKKIEGYYICI